MLDDISDGLETLGLAEIDALGIFDIADELDEIERARCRTESSVASSLDLLRLNGEVVLE